MTSATALREPAALEALAALLGYPGPDAAARAGEAARRVERAVPEAGESIRRFLAWAEATPSAAQEEAYARTFDWSPTHGLEIGWHLFGETYDRGAFLVAMRSLLRRAGVSEGGDLPDHLRLVLVAVARLPEAETAAFVAGALVPALRRIVEGFGTEESPYRHLLEATAIAFGAAPVAAGKGGD